MGAAATMRRTKGQLLILSEEGFQSEHRLSRASSHPPPRNQPSILNSLVFQALTAWGASASSVICALGDLAIGDCEDWLRAGASLYILLHSTAEKIDRFSAGGPPETPAAVSL
eukprot:1461784-Pyramimonas_sp.AAC.1